MGLMLFRSTLSPYRRRVRVAGPSVLSALLLSSCGLAGGGASVSPLTVEMRQAPRAALDEELRKQSRLTYHYMLGELALAQGEQDAAREHLAEASKLLEEPAPELHTRLAQLYLLEGKLAEALEESARARSAEPADASAMMLHAGLLDVVGRDAEADALYEKAMASHPHLFSPYLLLAHRAWRKGEHVRALSLLAEFQRRFDSEAVGPGLRALVLESQGKLQEARSVMDQALELDAGDRALSLERARMALEHGEAGRALPIVQDAIKRDPGNALLKQVTGLLEQARYTEALELLRREGRAFASPLDLRLKLAMMHAQRQQLDDSARELNLVLGKRPDFGQARYYLASLYSGMRREEDAIRELFKVPREDRLFVRSRALAAILLRQRDEPAQAERALREALEVEPDSPTLLSYLVSVLRELKRYAEAESLLRGALLKDPKDDRLLFNLALVLEESKKRAQALEMMEQVIEVNPRHSEALNFLAYEIAESGPVEQLDQAEALVRRALEVKPNDGYYLDTLGWIEYRRGNYEKAEEILARAMTLSGHDVVIMEHYGDVLQKRGQLEEAREIYRSALERSQDANEKELQELIERLRKKIAALQ